MGKNGIIFDKNIKEDILKKKSNNLFKLSMFYHCLLFRNMLSIMRTREETIMDKKKIILKAFQLKIFYIFKTNIQDCL